MSEYLIQSETLDDIADAINAKTGGSSAMTPAEMVTAIGSISGGGGRTLLADFTTSEDVSAIQIDFTQSMQGYDLYRVVMTGTFSRQPYPYVGVNTTTSTAYLNPFVEGGSITNNSHWECSIVSAGGIFYALLGNRTSPINGALGFFYTRVYDASAVFKSGFNIKIWGYTA